MLNTVKYLLIIGIIVLLGACEQRKLFRSVLVPIETNNKYGLIDQNGTLIVDTKYESIRISENQKHFICFSNRKAGILNIYGEMLYDCTYDFISDLYGGYIGTKGDQKYILSLSGKSTQVSTTITSHWKNGLYISKNEQGQYGMINEDGKEILPHVYNSIDRLDDSYKYFKYLTECEKLNVSGDYLYIQKSNKEGVVNTNGNILIDPVFDYISAFIDGKAYIVKDDKLGIIDSSGTILFEGEYDKLNEIDKNLSFSVHKDNPKNYESWAFEKLAYAENMCSLFPILYQNNANYTLENDSIKYQLNENIDRAYLTKNDYITIIKKKYYGILSSKLVEVIPCIYNSIFNVSKNTFIVKKKNKYGLINNKDSLISPIIFDELSFIEPSNPNYNSTILAFKHERKWALGYSHDKLLTSYDFISMPLREFYFGTWERTAFIKVETEKGLGLIDTTGKKIIKPSKEYSDFAIFEDIILVKDTNSKQYSRMHDYKGNIIYERKGCDIIDSPIKGIFTVYFKNSKSRYLTGYINSNGKWIWKSDNFR